MGIVKKLSQQNLVNEEGNADVYPVTHAKAVYADVTNSEVNQVERVQLQKLLDEKIVTKDNIEDIINGAKDIIGDNIKVFTSNQTRLNPLKSWIDIIQDYESIKRKIVTTDTLKEQIENIKTPHLNISNTYVEYKTEKDTYKGTLSTMLGDIQNKADKSLNGSSKLNNNTVEYSDANSHYLNSLTNTITDIHTKINNLNSQVIKTGSYLDRNPVHYTDFNGGNGEAHLGEVLSELYALGKHLQEQINNLKNK